MLLALLFFSCYNNSSNEQEEEAETFFAWQASLNDSSGVLEVRQTEAEGPAGLTAEDVVQYLNNRNPQVQLQIRKVSGDTIFLYIADAAYLTQKMGSSGPVLYFAEAVYHLTEIPGIHYADFDFEEGDHAQPEVLSREKFRQ